MKISKNTLYIICAAVIGFFLMCAVITIVVNKNDKSESEEQTEETVKENRDKLIDKDRKNSDADGNSKAKEDEMDPMEELNGLIGLESVKEEVASLVNYIKVQKSREAKGLKTPNISYHLVFTGNPGTGKTTVARILARIYKDLGVCRTGQMIETDRSGLIGAYVGQTAPKVNAMCDSALGGVLFIDEAYAITDGSKGNDYGDEAVATLLKRMEDNRDDLIVIVAGYTKEMENFIEANPGLKSRFTRYINFPDYSANELYKIYMMRINKYGLTLTPQADARVQEIMERAIAQKDRNFGNGRYVRNLFENTVTAQADRLGNGKVSNLKEKDLNTIEVSDVETAFKKTKN